MDMTRPDPKEPRTASLSVRTKPSIKSLVDQFALADDHSVTQVIERLVTAEAARRAALIDPKASKKK